VVRDIGVLATILQKSFEGEEIKRVKCILVFENFRREKKYR